MEPAPYHNSADKRALDLVGAGTALLALSPLCLLVALAIKLDSPGPVLHVDSRDGVGQRSFRLYKFRTMFNGAHARRPSMLSRYGMTEHPFQLERDPRVTVLGRWLRRWSIDEIPQLLNVLRGDMSLVGPRPLLPEDLLHDAPDADEWKHRRALVRPGITGPWQIHSRCNEEQSHRKMREDDLRYVTRASLWQDLRILVKTPRAIARGLRSV